MILRLFFFLLCIGFRLLASSQTPTPIKWGQFISKTTEKTQLTNNQTNYYLVKLGGNTSNTKNQLLKKTVQRKLDSQHAIVSLSEKDYKLFKNHFQAIWQTNNLWKYSPNLLNMSDNKTYVFLVKTKLPNQLKALIKENTTIETTKILNNLFILKASLEDIEKRIAPANHVYYIGLESMYPKTESKIAELDLSVNGINRIHHQYISLTNADQTISVKDHMFDENDLDLAGKKVTSPTASDTIDPHATAMATIIAGAGNTSSHGKGVAFKSKITSSYFRNLLPDTFSHLSNLGVSVQNHSYGTKIENFYGSVAEAYDEFCYSHPEFLHLFSSGNTGDSVSQNGYYQNIIGYANITGNYKMSKNTLCIGAMDFNDKTATFSSKGPAHDGRIKPELVAYSYIGTSNSTALISGLGMLLQQQYKNQFGHLPLSS